MEQTSPTSNFEFSPIKLKAAELQAALDASAPNFSSLLREIHTSIKNDPSQVTLLSAEEITTVVRGLEKQTNTYLAESVTKKKTSTKALAKTKMEDLF